MLDLTKLTAVINWIQPKDCQELVSFLGLTSHFQNLIKGYVHVKAPLRDLVKEVKLLLNYTKTTYRAAMKKATLDTSKWTLKHTKAFLALKKAPTSELVLRGPKWDGTPFVVTTDGCKEGFGAVLTQCFSTTLPNGKTVDKMHQFAFTSKRTSSTEQKYKPFILKFAACSHSTSLAMKGNLTLRG